MALKKFLFFGDLAPKYLTGTSISSSLILAELEGYFEILTVEEDDNFQYENLRYYLKVFNILEKYVKLLIKSLFQKISVFYLVLSTSTMGCIKTLFCILIVKITSPNSSVIVHVHRGDFFANFYTKKTNQVFTKIIFYLSKSIILLSEKQLPEFELEFPNVTFSVLENTIDIEPDQEDLKKDNCSKNNFIYISNYFEEKGIYDLLKCFKELIINGHPIELDTYGKFSSPLLKNEILKYNSEKIRIHGSISGNQKHSEIRKSSCLILPSWNEGQPLVILEAMANATPVIATNVGLLPEMLGENYEFLYSAKNIDELKNKVLLFLSKQNADKIGISLYNRYQKYYSKSIHRKKVLAIFI